MAYHAIWIQRLQQQLWVYIIHFSPHFITSTGAPWETRPPRHVATPEWAIYPHFSHKHTHTHCLLCAGQWSVVYSLDWEGQRECVCMRVCAGGVQQAAMLKQFPLFLAQLVTVWACALSDTEGEGVPTRPTQGERWWYKWKQEAKHKWGSSLMIVNWTSQNLTIFLKYTIIPQWKKKH